MSTQLRRHAPHVLGDDRSCRVCHFLVFGKNPDALTWGVRVAHCESHDDPNPVSAWSGATRLFQFMPRPWNAYFGGAIIWDPVSQARPALNFYLRGWTYQWECR